MLLLDAEPSRKERGHRGVRPRHPGRPIGPPRTRLGRQMGSSSGPGPRRFCSCAEPEGTSRAPAWRREWPGAAMVARCGYADVEDRRRACRGAWRRPARHSSAGCVGLHQTSQRPLERRAGTGIDGRSSAWGVTSQQDHEVQCPWDERAGDDDLRGDRAHRADHAQPARARQRHHPDLVPSSRMRRARRPRPGRARDPAGRATARASAAAMTSSSPPRVRDAWATEAVAAAGRSRRLTRA